MAKKSKSTKSTKKAKATKKDCEVNKMKKLGTKNMGNKRCVQCIKDCRMVPRKGQIEEEDVEMEDVDGTNTKGLSGRQRVTLSACCGIQMDTFIA